MSVGDLPAEINRPEGKPETGVLAGSRVGRRWPSPPFEAAGALSKQPRHALRESARARATQPDGFIFLLKADLSFDGDSLAFGATQARSGEVGAEGEFGTDSHVADLRDASFGLGEVGVGGSDFFRS